MWLCMKWHGAWLYGVHRNCAERAAVSCSTSHASAVDIKKEEEKKTHYKKLVTHVDRRIAKNSTIWAISINQSKTKLCVNSVTQTLHCLTFSVLWKQHSLGKNYDCSHCFGWRDCHRIFNFTKAHRQPLSNPTVCLKVITVSVICV